jgi:hypothetical protein
MPRAIFVRSAIRVPLALALSLATSACSARPGDHATPRPASRQPNPDTTGARRRAIADSIDQAQANRFFTVLQARSAPLINAANYLGVLQLIDTLVTAAGSTAVVKEAAGQMIGTYDSFLGQYQAALESFVVGPPRLAPPDTSSFAGYVPENATDAIARIAAANQVVFINEAHHVPRHRAFTLALLPRLRELGFSYLAVEALFESESTLNARKYPIEATGFYTNEPTFGELLRVAMRLGFTLVPYESSSGSQDQRETGQARNLVDRILAKDPRARVIVHAGYEHINESGTLIGATPMAVHFREMTGIDPLTIDQTVMTESGDTLHDDPRYRHFVGRNALRAPVLLRKGESFWSAKPGVHDVSVIHPRAIYRDGRPDWLWAMENRRPYTLPANVCAPSTECVVAARIAAESADAVPVDALRIRTTEVAKTLALPPGEYVITARDGSGKSLSERRATIVP